MADVPRAWTRVSGLLSPLQRPCGACELGHPETTPLARLGSPGWPEEAGFPETAPRKGLNVPRHLASRWGGGGARARREHLISERLLLRKPFPSPRRVGSEPTLSLEPRVSLPDRSCCYFELSARAPGAAGAGGRPVRRFRWGPDIPWQLSYEDGPEKDRRGAFSPLRRRVLSSASGPGSWGNAQEALFGSIEFLGFYGC